MSVSRKSFFDLSLAANALGMWTMTSESGISHDFHSRTEALAFALCEARKSLQDAPGVIRIEGPDLRWRSFDDELKPLMDRGSLADEHQLSR